MSGCGDGEEGSGEREIVAASWVCRRTDGALLGVRPHGAGAFLLPGGVPEDGETDAEAAEIALIGPHQQDRFAPAVLAALAAIPSQHDRMSGWRTAGRGSGVNTHSGGVVTSPPQRNHNRLLTA